MPIARIALRGDGSEREAAHALLRHLRPDDILLADRGYQGHAMLKAIQATGCRFILRVPSGTNAWREFRQLQRRRIRDACISITVDEDVIRLRHIRVSGGPGRPRMNTRRETQFLLTNLPAAWSVKRIGALYAARWGVETMFRELKVTLEGGGLRARTRQGILQELDARCIHLTIAAYLDITAIVEVGTIARRHTFTVNRSALLLIVTIMLILPDDDLERRRRSAQAAVAAALGGQAKRSGRYSPRKKPMFAKVR